MKDSLSATILTLLCACGPARAPSSSAETESDSSTDDPSTTGTSTETEDPTEQTTNMTDTVLTNIVPEGDDMWLDVCDPFAQNCPEGEKCVPYSSDGGNWNANKCVPIMGEQMPGEPCVYGGAVEATDDCDATSMCWYLMDVEGQLVGECVPFCMGTIDAPECPEGSFCPISDDGVLNICLPKCDPVAQDCDEGFECDWTGTNFACVITGEDIPVGESCSFVNDCASGLLCAAGEYLPACDGVSCCTAFCDLQLGAMQCAALPGTSCLPFFEPQRTPPEYEHVGVCIVP
jgi:hypothetical protein